MRLVLWIEHLLFFRHVLLWCVLRAGGLALLHGVTHGQWHYKVLSFSRRAILCRRQAALKAPAHSFLVSTELDSSNRVAAVAVRNWRTRRICSCLSDVAPSCPEAEIKNKTHVNPLGAAPETRQEPGAGRLRTRGERANGTHGRPAEGGTAKREDRRLCDGGNAPSPLHLLPCFCGGSI